MTLIFNTLLKIARAIDIITLELTNRDCSLKIVSKADNSYLMYNFEEFPNKSNNGIFRQKLFHKRNSVNSLAFFKNNAHDKSLNCSFLQFIEKFKADLEDPVEQVKWESTGLKESVLKQTEIKSLDNMDKLLGLFDENFVRKLDGAFENLKHGLIIYIKETVKSETIDSLIVPLLLIEKSSRMRLLLALKKNKKIVEPENNSKVASESGSEAEFVDSEMLQETSQFALNGIRIDVKCIDVDGAYTIETIAVDTKYSEEPEYTEIPKSNVEVTKWNEKDDDGVPISDGSDEMTDLDENAVASVAEKKSTSAKRMDKAVKTSDISQPNKDESTSKEVKDKEAPKVKSQPLSLGDFSDEASDDEYKGEDKATSPGKSILTPGSLNLIFQQPDSVQPVADQVEEEEESLEETPQIPRSPDRDVSSVSKTDFLSLYGGWIFGGIFGVILVLIVVIIIVFQSKKKQAQKIEKRRIQSLNRNF